MKLWLFRFFYFARVIFPTLFFMMVVIGVLWHLIAGPTCDEPQTTSTGITWQVCH